MQKRGLNYKFAYFLIIGILLFFAIFLLIVINQSTQVSFSPGDSFTFFEDFSQNITSNPTINQNSIDGVVWDGQSSYILTPGVETSSNLQGLIGLWRFNSLSSGDPPNTPGAVNNLPAECLGVGCPTVVSMINSKLGSGSLNFTFNDFINAPPSDQDVLSVFATGMASSLQNQFTLSAWVNPSENNYSPNLQMAIISAYFTGNAAWNKESIGLSIRRNSDIPGYSSLLSVTVSGCNSDLRQLGATNIVPFNQWSHVVATFDSATQQAHLYLNGQLVASSSTFDSIPCTNVLNPIEIGGSTHLVSGPYMGLMDEVSMWARSLSASEVNDLYLLGNGRVSGSFMSNAIDTGETFYSLNANWTENTNDVKLKISGNGLDYCDLSNGQTAYAPSCGLPSNDFIYLANLTNKAKLSSLLIFTNSTDNLPTINTVSPSNGSLVRSAQVFFTANLYDDAGLANVSLELNGFNYNFNQTASLSGQTSLVNISRTLPQEGVYTWRLKIRDVNNNLEQTGFNELYYYTPLLVNITSPKAITYNTSDLIFNITLNKAGSAKFTLNNGQTNATMQSSNNRDFIYVSANLTEGDYTFKLYAQENNYNINVSTVQFEIDLPGSSSVGTGSNGGSGGSGGSAGGSSGGSSSGITNMPNEWDNSIDRSDQELSQFGPLFIPLGVNERVLVLINGENHYVGVKQISNNLVSVEIASTPVKVDLEVGETWRVDGDSNGVYDFSVKVAGVASGFADLEIKVISEEVKVGDLEQQNSSVVGENAKVNFAFILIWVAIGILILAIFFLIRQLRRKNLVSKKQETGTFEIKNADDLEIDLR